MIARRQRSTAAFVSAMLLGLWARTAQAIDVSGSAGGGYARSDAWDGLHSDSTTWDWEADLMFAGSLFRPGFLQWMASGNYRAIRSAYMRARSRTDGFGFRLQCALLDDTPVPLSFFGSRTWSDFSTDGDATRTGGTVTNNYGATALVRVMRYPTLRASVIRTELQTSSLGGASSNSDSTGLTVGLSDNVASSTYSIDYATGWNHGSYAETNYQSHALNTQFTSAPSPTVRVRLSDRYYLRDPTNDDPMNPRYDDNSLGAGIQWRPGQRLTSSLDYAYRHLQVEVAAAPTVEELAHAVTATTFFRWKPTLALTSGAAFNYGLIRRGSEERRLAESANAGFVWRRGFGLTTFDAGAGGSVGLVEPQNADPITTYGGSISGGVSHPFQRKRLIASYVGSYQSGGAAQSGYALDQRLQVGVDGIARDDIFWRTLLVAAGARRQDALLGTSLSRSATILASAQWRRYNATLSLGESDGLAPALANPMSVGPSDGLFLPADYNTHTRYATLATTQIFAGGHVLLTQLLRTLHNDAPGRAAEFEDAAGVTASYLVGAVILSLDERYSYGGTGTSRQSVNLIMLRLLRTFGANL